MARRKHRPTDPAEAARKAALARRNPALWGVNEQALSMQPDISDTPESRGKTRRVFRYDCFATLSLPDGHLTAVRRLEELIAIRYRVDGNTKTQGKVDSGGSADLVTAKSMDAGRQIDAITGFCEKPWMGSLIVSLLTPATVDGVRVNWHQVVRNRLGLIDRGQQSKAVKQACAGLYEAFTRWDDGERPAELRRAA